MRDGAAGTERPPGVIGATIITRSGTYFDFADPEGSEICIEDIAAGLSRTCRYGGQLPDDVELYTVAQHAVLVSLIVPQEHALAALHHDDAEAYMGDLPSPLKQLCPDFKVIEKRVERAIFGRFGLPLEMHAEIKKADIIALHTEKRDISAARGHEWPGLADYPPLDMKIVPWGQRHSMEAFLRRHHFLTTGH